MMVVGLVMDMLTRPENVLEIDKFNEFLGAALELVVGAEISASG